jgi:hypothetical protein
MSDLDKDWNPLPSDPPKDGGPAFPRVGEGFGNPNYDAPGMSLRDWFAGQALTGIYASNWFTWLVSRDNPHEVEADDAAAARAYKVADAMLAQRAKEAK